MTFPARLSALPALAFALALPLGAPAQEIAVTHPQGELVLPGVPEIVIVTDWAALDTLDALGVEVFGVPGSNPPAYLAGRVPADALPVGSFQNLDLDAIAAAEPDLVVVAGRTRSAYPAVSEIAPTYDASVSNSGIIVGVSANLETFGAIFGAEDRAAERIAALEEKVGQLREAARDQGNAIVVLTNNGNLRLYGADSRTSWIHNEAGIPSVLDENGIAAPEDNALSPELLIEADPDWVFVVERDAISGNRGAARELLEGPAFETARFRQNERIVYLDPQAAYITMHGYSGLLLMIDQILEAFEGAS